MKSGGERKFEEALQELEHIVERLESGELALEESLAAFEAGVALVRQLNEKLKEVERRVEVLTRDEEGNLRTDEIGDEGED
jgi:exodeoxyribonuclease VII small subunit